MNTSSCVGLQLGNWPSFSFFHLSNKMPRTNGLTRLTRCPSLFMLWAPGWPPRPGNTSEFKPSSETRSRVQAPRAAPRANSLRSKFKNNTIWPSYWADPASQALAALHQDHLVGKGDPDQVVTGSQAADPSDQHNYGPAHEETCGWRGTTRGTRKMRWKEKVQVSAHHPTGVPGGQGRWIRATPTLSARAGLGDPTGGLCSVALSLPLLSSFF